MKKTIELDDEQLQIVISALAVFEPLPFNEYRPSVIAAARREKAIANDLVRDLRGLA